MKVFILIVCLVFTYYVFKMIALYVRGKNNAKEEPTFLKKGDKILYQREMYDLLDADVLIQSGSNVRIRITEKENYGKQLVVPRNSCHLVIDKNRDVI